jgi:hypothetical protein
MGGVRALGTRYAGPASFYDHPLCCVFCIFLSSLYITSSFFEVVFLAREVLSGFTLWPMPSPLCWGYYCLLVIDVLYLEALAHNHDILFCDPR